MSTSRFPTALKSTKVKPIFKNNSRTNKTNYRPVSLLPVVSKVYERLIYRQVSEYFEPVLSKKGHSAQLYLLVMVAKWKKCLD